MSKTYRPYQPTQSFLLPPSPLDWLPEDHLSRFVLDTVAELDLSELHTHYEREARGKPPHHPQMMVALLLYAYCVGVPSSRKIEKRTYEERSFLALACHGDLRSAANLVPKLAQQSSGCTVQVDKRRQRPQESSP